MNDAPYTIVVEGGATSTVSERKLAKHAPGTLINTSVIVVSNTVVGGTRTVVMTRALKGLTPDHYTFDPTVLTIPFISAVGIRARFGPHNAAPHGAAEVQLWPAGAVCICSVPATPFGLGKGTLEYLPTGEVHHRTITVSH